jgi:hypothetical protein
MNAITYVIVVLAISALLFGSSALIIWFMVRRLQRGDRGEFPTRGVRKQVVRVQTPPNDLDALSRTALLTTLPGAAVLAEDGHRIMVKSRLTWRSWGEFVQVQYNQETGEATVSSAPVLGPALIDSANRKNVRRIAQFLTEKSSSR